MSIVKTFRAGLMAVSVMALAVPAFATEPPAGPKADTWVIPSPPTAAPAVTVEQAPPTRSPWRYVAIAAVLGVLGYVAFESRKRRFGRQLPPSGRLVLLDSLRVGPQAQLVVVSVAGRTMLLSVTAGNVRRLCPLDEWQSQSATQAERESGDVSPADLPRPAFVPVAVAPSFGQMLRRFVTNLEVRAPDAASQIAEQTMDRVDIRPRPPVRTALADMPMAQPNPLARAVRKPRQEDVPPVRKQLNTPHVESQASGLLARRSARGA